MQNQFQYLNDEGVQLLSTRRRSQEELFDCLQKMVLASMTLGLIGIGVAFVFLLEYMAGW